MQCHPLFLLCILPCTYRHFFSHTVLSTEQSSKTPPRYRSHCFHRTYPRCRIFTVNALPFRHTRTHLLHSSSEANALQTPPIHFPPSSLFAVACICVFAAADGGRRELARFQPPSSRSSGQCSHAAPHLSVLFLFYCCLLLILSFSFSICMCCFSYLFQWPTYFPTRSPGSAINISLE